MNKRKRHPALTALLSIAFAFACAGAAFGQQAADAKSAPATQAAPTSNTQTVNAQQSGAWAVGIDPTNNSVRLPNTTSDPLPVKVVGGAPARKPFQKRVLLTPLGTGFQTEFLPLPAGKRLVIENISVVSRCAEGQKMEINYFTYMDNGDSTNTDGI